MIWKVKLKGKTLPAYTSPDSIKVSRHIKNPNKPVTATEFYEDSYRSRYFIPELNAWISESQVLVLSQEEEKVETVVDPYKSDILVVNSKIDSPMYVLSGATMNRVSDLSKKFPAETNLTVNGTFTQHRGGKTEIFYRLADEEYEGYWILSDTNLSVIENLSKPKEETKTKKKIKRISYAAPVPQPRTEDDEDEGDTGEDDPANPDGITIGAFWEDGEENTDQSYDSYADWVRDALGDGIIGNIAGTITENSEGTWVGNIIKSAIDTYNKFTSSESEIASGVGFGSVPIHRYNFVHGMPFQFTPISDRRYYNDTTVDNDEDNCDQYGRSFAQTIVADTPVVVFTPGLPRYLTSESLGITASAEEQDSLMNLVANPDDTSAVQEVFNTDKNLEYFSLGVTTTEYFKYVNTLCRNSSILMEIGQLKYHNVACENLDWGKYNTDIDNKSALADVLGIDGGVAFAFDPQSGISDTLTNTTTDSSIASQINQYSAQVRELEFIAGATAASSLLEGLQSSISSIVGGISGGTTDDTGDGLFSRLGTGINNVVQGLNLKFPEIWGDSAQQKSYSCEMKFVSPYASIFCCWRYVLVPFFHLLPLAAPRATKSLNSYTSPFLIRAYSKGYFNVEMGIIDSLTYKRFGEGDMITADGIPMQMDCEVAFHDLYKQLTVCTAGGSNAALFFNNTGLIDLLGTLSGVNMCRMDPIDRLSMFTVNSYNAVMDIKTNFRRKISDKFNTFFAKFSPTY